MKKYSISYEERLAFVSLILLNEIINFQHYFEVNNKQGEDYYLNTYLDHMVNKGVLEIQDNRYIPTDKGREELVTLYAKYDEYLKVFDIFCAVDLEAGEFAFSSIYDEKFDDQAWENFLAEERFSDIRVAVCDFKGINPIEIVFLSFLNENRFDCTQPNWQFNLTSQSIWTEIEDICNSAISVDYLKEDGVLEDVITQGSKIALELIKTAEDILAAEDEEEEIIEEEITTTTTTETVEEYVDIVEEPYYPYDYYYGYYDPFYVSPIWVAAVILF